MSLARTVAARMAAELSALPPSEAWAASELVRRTVEACQERAARDLGVTIAEFRLVAFSSPDSESYLGGVTDVSQNVTEPSQSVTRCHVESNDET